MNATPSLIGDRMNVRQWLVVALCAALNALDGYDVLSISFAAPGIARDWGVQPAALGVVLSIELAGMAAGAVLLGQLADRVGRRPVLLGAVISAVAGMALAAQARGVIDLSFFRLLTGLGLGGILAVTPTVAAEVSASRYRNLAVSLTSGGYPIGAFAGGAVATQLVAGGWHDVFLFGAITTGCIVPLLWWLMPETPAFLASRQPVRALERINATLARLRMAQISALPGHVNHHARQGVRGLFVPGLAPVTLLLVFAYLAHVGTVYYVYKWAPKIVADLGFTAQAAGSVLVWCNAGGTVGSILFSVLAHRIAPARAMFVTLQLSFAGVAAFGLVPPTLAMLSAAACVAGFGTSATIVLFYAILSGAFPVSLRATGTGFVVGIGRAGSSLSPIAAGILLSMNLGRSCVSIIMSCGSLVALVCLLALLPRLRNKSM